MSFGIGDIIPWIQIQELLKEKVNVLLFFGTHQVWSVWVQIFCGKFIYHLRVCFFLIFKDLAWYFIFSDYFFQR